MFEESNKILADARRHRFTDTEAELYSMPLVIPAEKHKMAPPPCRVVPMPYSLNPVKQYRKTRRRK